MIEEKITCSDETYCQLGSYLCQSELGNYEPDKHKGDYLTGFKFAPRPTPALIERLALEHKKRRGLTAPEAELEFLQIAKKLSIYGLDFYPVKDSNETNFTIGVCSSGLSVYSKDSVCVETLPWTKIVKVCYNCENFSIKVKPTEEKVADEKPVDDNRAAENTVSFKLCSPKAAYGLWQITVAHHTFFKSLHTQSKKASKKSSKSAKHRRSKEEKEEKSSSKHHHKKAKSKKESGSSNSASRPKRRREEATKSLNYREERTSYRDEVYRDGSRGRSSKRVKIDASRKESSRREERRDEREKDFRKESRKEHSSGRERRGDHRDDHRDGHRDEDRRNYREEARRGDYREKERKTYRDDEKSYDRSRSRRDDKASSPKSKRHKHKHSKNESTGETAKRPRPISIAESHYRSLAKESMNQLNEKIKSKEEKKNKHKSRKTDEKALSPAKASNHFAKEQTASNDAIVEAKKESSPLNGRPEEAGQNEKVIISSAKETSSSLSKPGSPPKKDVKLSSKSNVEFNIFWDGAENESARSDETTKQQQQQSNKTKDDSLISNDGEKRFIPRVLLNGNDTAGAIGGAAGTGKVFTKFEIKSSTRTRTGPKTPPDDFDMFADNSTVSNQSIPTPTQDESQPGLNEKFHNNNNDKHHSDKFNNNVERRPASLVDSSNANSVRSLSPRSMQSDTALISTTNNNPTSSTVTATTKTQSSALTNAITNPSSSVNLNLNLSSLKQISNNGHHSASKSSKSYDPDPYYDPEAPLDESPEQQPASNSLYPSNSYGLKSNLFGSASAKPANGNNEMEIDSPFSPSKPINSINSPIVQPKASTSATNQQPLPQFTGSELKQLVDHLIKAAKLQKKAGDQSNNVKLINNNNNSNNNNNDNNSGFGAMDDDLPSSAVELNSREKVCSLPLLFW